MPDLLNRFGAVTLVWYKKIRKLVMYFLATSAFQATDDQATACSICIDVSSASASYYRQVTATDRAWDFFFAPNVKFSFSLLNSRVKSDTMTMLGWTSLSFVCVNTLDSLKGDVFSFPLFWSLYPSFLGQATPSAFGHRKMAVTLLILKYESAYHF